MLHAVPLDLELDPDGELPRRPSADAPAEREVMMELKRFAEEA